MTLKHASFTIIFVFLMLALVSNASTTSNPEEIHVNDQLVDNNPFTSGSPELKDCLRQTLGEESFNTIALGNRPPTEDENRLMGSCMGLNSDQRDDSKISQNKNNKDPFTSGSPELKDCLRQTLGEESFNAIALGSRPPTKDENRLMGSCMGLNPDQRDNSKDSRNQNDKSPFTSPSPELKSCLRQAVGEESFSAIVNTPRKPTPEEEDLIQPCITQTYVQGFISGSLEQKNCLRQTLGEESFDTIALGRRLPTREERNLIDPCFSGQRDNSKDSRNQNDKSPFTSGPPEVLNCLRQALGEEVYNSIALGRKPTQEESGLIGPCMSNNPDQKSDSEISRGQNDHTIKGVERTLWSSTHSVQTPDASRITVSFEPGPLLGKAHITGTSGAVTPGEELTIVNLELGLPSRVNADLSGAFETEIDAVPGSHIFITETVGDAASGVLLPIRPDGITMGGSRVGEAGVPWSITATMQDRTLQQGQRVSLSGKVFFPISLDQSPSRASLHILGTLIGDAAGQQVGLGAEFVSTFLTQTSLPIERRFMYRFQDREIASHVPLSWTLKGGFWEAGYATTVTIPQNYVSGLYRLSALLQLEGSIDITGEDTEGRFTRMGNCCDATIGNFTVGSPARMRLATTILADILDEGSRGGVLATQDNGQFDVSARVATRHNPVVPRRDGLGKSLSYQLEPYLPMFGAIDRQPPGVPPLLLDFNNSELTITIMHPDGTTDQLGPAPLTHMTFNMPMPPTMCIDQGISTGGHLSGLIQLRRSDDTFLYEFTADGSYTVRLDGLVADYDGRTFEISGDYEVTVANSLKINPSLLPGTPFEIGDALSPALSVVPPAPVSITYTITHVAADGLMTNEVFTGTANKYGIWDAAGKAYTFTRAGEYRVDIEASYETVDGELWMGRMRFGSVVASADPAIILHGRRGSGGISTLPPPWFFRSRIDPDREGHLFPPYFTGDVQWGVSANIGDNAVSFRNSIQIIDTNNTLVAKVLAQFREFGEPLSDDISAEQQITAGQILLLTFQDAGSSLAAMQPDDIGLWAYTYASAQRPSMRVREFVQGVDVENAYWSFDDPYHLQSGNGPQGDLPGEFKYLYSGVVLRDTVSKQGEYAIYGSGWVLAPDDDPGHARVFPPFQGAAGGPDGGALFTVHEREIDMFFLPLGVRPGSMLEVGDMFRMTGPIMPTLPSKVEYTVISPDGTPRTFAGYANSIGYYYDPADDFKLDQSGLWTVKLKVIHDGMTSAGPVEEPFPTGSVLSPDGATYTFVVTDPKTNVLAIRTDLEEVSPYSWYCHNIQEAYFRAAIPDSMVVEQAHITVTMPGIVLVDEDVTLESSEIRWDLDAKALNELASNFDVSPGIADTITVTFFAKGTVDGRSVQTAGTIVTHGARLALALPNP